MNREILLSKVQFQKQKRKVIQNRDEFLKLVEAVETVLSEVEEELAAHNGNRVLKYLFAIIGHRSRFILFICSFTELVALL